MGDSDGNSDSDNSDSANSDSDSALETGSSGTDDCEAYDGDCRSATRVKWLLRRRRWRER
jgi:hypothetical protein